MQLIRIKFTDEHNDDWNASLMEDIMSTLDTGGVHYSAQVIKPVPFDDIRAWAAERGIYEKGDPKTQFAKLIEEVGELAKAILKNDRPEIVDGIGDAVVVLTNLAHLCGYAIEDCVMSAYGEIKARKGKMQNGTFVKEQ